MKYTIHCRNAANTTKLDGTYRTTSVSLISLCACKSCSVTSIAATLLKDPFRGLRSSICLERYVFNKYISVTRKTILKKIPTLLISRENYLSVKRSSRAVFYCAIGYGSNGHGQIHTKQDIQASIKWSEIVVLSVWNCCLNVCTRYISSVGVVLFTKKNCLHLSDSKMIICIITCIVHNLNAMLFCVKVLYRLAFITYDNIDVYLYVAYK